MLKLAAMKGLFTQVVSDPVSYVNAPLYAEQRNVEVRFSADTAAESFRNVITLRGVTEDGTRVSVSGTLTGPKQVEKIVEINGYELELPISEHLIVFSYTDRPGIVAAYGGLLGDAGVNIAGLQIARDEKKGTALSVLSIDASVPADLIERLGEAIGADVLRAIDLVVD